jgi:hypothetical protein
VTGEIKEDLRGQGRPQVILKELPSIRVGFVQTLIRWRRVADYSRTKGFREYFEKQCMIDRDPSSISPWYDSTKEAMLELDPAWVGLLRMGSKKSFDLAMQDRPKFTFPRFFKSNKKLPVIGATVCNEFVTCLMVEISEANILTRYFLHHFRWYFAGTYQPGYLLTRAVGMAVTTNASIPYPYTKPQVIELEGEPANKSVKCEWTDCG